MKKFIIVLLLIVAAIFPILFIPLLAATLLITFVVIPQLAKHGVWVRLFAESNALRFGLPPDGGWQQLEQALELEQHLMG